MLKVRVIPLLIIQDGLLKKPVKFENPRTIANPISVVRIFEERGVDELILLDRGKTLDEEDIDPYLVKEISEELYVPFAFGGGIYDVQSMKAIIQAGAEKVVLNSHAVMNPSLIESGARKFGSQCIVISIDAQKDDSGSYKVYVKSGSKKTNLDPVEWAIEVEKRGAGEILINSILHDGVMRGYDLKLIKLISDNVNIPVIAAGGAGNVEHFPPAIIDGGASAVAAGSIYHYTKYTPNMVKGVLKSAGLLVRMYNDTDYNIT